MNKNLQSKECNLIFNVLRNLIGKTSHLSFTQVNISSIRNTFFFLSEIIHEETDTFLISQKYLMDLSSDAQFHIEN